MGEKSKKILSYLFQKKAISFLLALIILGNFVFIEPALAQMGPLMPVEGVNPSEVLIRPEGSTETASEAYSRLAAEAAAKREGEIGFWGGLVQRIGSAIVGTVFYVIGSITGLLADLGGRLLKWVISPSFTNLPYTKPGPISKGGNPIIELGLGITQSFVNLVLVLVLVYIALATILRLAGYETKKLLATFAIVALLVNFAPVICGLIVDASNIVMNFFLNELTKKTGFFNEITELSKKLGELWGNLFVKDGAKNMVNAAGEIFTLAIIHLFTFFLYLLFSVIFIVRYMAIWLLVILSPIAFASYILPATRKLWNLWWNQFLQWSIIGITCGFFLYLAEKLASTKGEYFPGPGSSFGSTFMINLVPLLFLALGLIFGLQTSAMGAGAIIGGMKKGGKWTGRWVAKRGLRGIGRFAEEKMRLKEGVGRVAKAWGKVPIGRWFLPETVKKYGEFSPGIEEAQKEAKSYSTQTNMDDVMTGEAIGKRAAGKTLETVERADSQDIFQSGKKRFGKDLTDEQLLEHPGFRKIMKRTLHVAKNGGKLNSIIRRDPRLAALLAGEKWAGEEYEKRDRKGAIAKAVSEVRSSHINNMEPEVLKNRDVMRAALGYWDRDAWLAVSRNVKRGQLTAHDTMDEDFSEFIKEKKLTEEDVKSEKALGEYRKQVEKECEGKAGYFKAVSEPRMKKTSWRKPEFIPPGEREKEKGKSATPAKAMDLGVEKVARGLSPELQKVVQKAAEKPEIKKIIDNIGKLEKKIDKAVQDPKTSNRKIEKLERERGLLESELSNMLAAKRKERKKR